MYRRRDRRVFSGALADVEGGPAAGEPVDVGDPDLGVPLAFPEGSFLEALLCRVW